jgi:hypothetical protein
MKKILTALCLAALLIGCQKYDDTQIKDDLTEQNNRIEQLARQIAELRQLVDALSAGDYVTGVAPIVQDNATVGITISFKNSPSVQIHFATGGSSNGISSAALENSVLVITLTSGEVVRIPVTTVPVITLEKETVLVFAGNSATVAYMVAGGDEGNSVQTLVEGLWAAEAVSTNAGAGSITVTAPNPCGAAKVVAVVTSGTGLSSFKTLECLEARFSVAKASYGVASDAGQLKVDVENNIGAFTVEIPTEATWLSATATEEDVTFTIEENTGDERQATVKLKNDEYQAEISFKIVQEDGGTYVWKPISSVAQVVAGDCVLAFLRESDSKLLFISGAAAINRNPVAAEAAAAGVTVDGDDITSVNAAYIWKISASGEYWNFAGSNGLYLIGCDKYQGVAVLTDLKGNYHSTNTYSRNWYFEDDATHGMQMKVTESAGRQLMIADAATTWTMNPTGERNGKIVIYYKTHL